MKRGLGTGLLVIVLVGAVASASGASPGVEFRAALYAVRGDGSGDHLLVEPDPPVSGFVRSPGGQSILFSKEVDGVSALFAADRSGADAVRLTPPELSVSGTGVFSPDGRVIAFSSASPCGWRCFHASLYVVRRDGGDLRLVAENAADPSWAPDSRRLVYGGSRGTYGPALDIFVTDIVSDETTQVAQGTVDWPVWAPRGERIAYWADQGGYGVACFVNADGSRRRCTRGHSLTSLVWSPDARFVAFRQANPRRLGIVDSDARHVRYLGYHGREARPTAWSPDGRGLAYFDSGYSQINVLRLAAPERVVRVVDKPGNFLSDVRWRASGITYVAARPVAP